MVLAPPNFKPVADPMLSRDIFSWLIAPVEERALPHTLALPRCLATARSLSTACERSAAQSPPTRSASGCPLNLRYTLRAPSPLGAMAEVQAAASRTRAAGWPVEIRVQYMAREQ